MDATMFATIETFHRYPEVFTRELIRVHVQKISEDDASTPLQCYCYVLTHSKPELLQEPHLDEYESDGAHARPFQTGSMEQCGGTKRSDCIKQVQHRLGILLVTPYLLEEPAKPFQKLEFSDILACPMPSIQ